MGRDKAFIEIGCVPLWRRQLRILEELAPAEIFLAGSPDPAWKNAGCAIIADAKRDAGPLGGLVGALRCCSTSLLLVLAVDLPHMTSNYLRGLLGLCGAGKGAIPFTGRYEPLVAVYPTVSLPLGEELLSAGRYSLQEFARHCVDDELATSFTVSPSDATFFLNLNTPADLIAVNQ